MFIVGKLPLGPRKPFYLCMKSYLISFKVEFLFQSIEFLWEELSSSSKWIIIFVPLEKVNIFSKQYMQWKVSITGNQRPTMELVELFHEE